MRAALVATTVGEGSFIDNYVRAVQQEELMDDILFIIIPDLKTPRSVFERCAGAERLGMRIRCPTVEEQDAYLERLGEIRKVIPYNSDNRRNIGFLMALEGGCDVVISVDDDNFPRSDAAFFREHLTVNQTITLPAVHCDRGWFNICDLMKVEPSNTFPRGFPYRYRSQSLNRHTQPERGTVHMNIGLWLGHPDVDAVTCLTAVPQATEFRGQSVFLGDDTWSPINTQNTAVARDAIAAYYFLRMGYPVMGIPMDRDGDIFSGYFVQACARHLDYRVRVGTPLTNHLRNTHNYLNDLTRELPCIWILEDLADWLPELRLEGRTYSDTYLGLAALLEDAVEGFSGFIWTDATRGYFHYMAYCMRTWVKAVNSLAGER